MWLSKIFVVPLGTNLVLKYLCFSFPQRNGSFLYVWLDIMSYDISFGISQFEHMSAIPLLGVSFFSK